MSGKNPFKRFAFGAAPATEKRTAAPETASVAQVKRIKRDDSERGQPLRAPRINIASGDDAEQLLAPVKQEHNDTVLLVKRDSTEPLRDIPVKLEYEDNHGEAARDLRLTLLLRLFKAREEMTTPIDAFGTQACVAPHAKVERNRRFHILVAALLSSQTNDKITHAAMQRLHKQLGGGDDGGGDSEGLTIAKVRITDEDSLDALINPVGFHRKKAQQLKQAAETLYTEYCSDIPRSYDELVRLPGIGPKIARVILLLAWHEVDGLIVDTHVHRLAHRLGWTSDGIPGSLRKSGPESIKTPEDTRKALENWIPQEHWAKFSLAVVGFGQSVCVAVNPKCASCPLADLCPSAFRVASSKKSKSTSKGRG